MKAGDKVKLLENAYHSIEDDRNDFAPGKTGVITGIEDQIGIIVVMDWDNSRFEYCFYSHELEII